MIESVIVFFDIGDTLAIPKLSTSGSVQQLVVLPFVPDVLTKLKSRIGSDGSPLQLGLISNTGTETLEEMRSLLGAAGLLDFFEPTLLLFSSIEGMDKTQKEFFQLASQRAGVPPSRCIYVGEDQAERTVAESAHFRVSYHPLHVFHVIDQMV
jgi:FMN phosphatase YigB (HAD superfamily)